MNITAPAIAGTPDVGATLTAIAGVWTGSGNRYSFVWLRCDDSGNNCAPIGGATETTRILASADLGSTLRFSVLAANRRGSTSATSDATSVVTAPPQPPSDPGGPLTPTGFTASNPTTNGIALAWISVLDAVDPPVGYRVYVDQALALSTTGISANVGGLACGKTYTFAVEAYDAAGKTSPRASTSASTLDCPPPPPPTSNSQIYWGAWIEGKDTYTPLYGGTWGNVPWDSHTWATYEQHSGKNPSIVHWGVGTPWGHSFSYWAGTLNLVHNAGALNLIDMDTGSTSLSSIASGSQDAAISTWALQAAAYGRPFFLRLNWEMNGGWFPWGTTSSNQNTPADYIAAWRHIHDLFTAAGATNTTWVWCPNLQWSNSVPYTQLYPGDAYVDWTCLDGYNFGSSSASFSSLYTQSYNSLLSVAPTKPIMIGEIGSIEYGTGVKATWISDMLSQLPTKFPQIKALVYFNWRCLTSGVYRRWEIESSASAQTAFSTGIAAPYYAAASSFTLPAPLTSIKPLP